MCIRDSFPAMPDYDQDLPTSHLLYLDCNSLCTTCQDSPLPVGGFWLLTDSELAVFDVTSMPADSSVGYFVECDLRYPTNLHDIHNAYPLAPEHVKNEELMLSDTLRFMLNKTDSKYTPSTKLVANLHDKTHYVTHYRCLQFYLTHGLELIKVHQVIAFNQSRYMLLFTKFCNDGRKNAQSDFESSLYKLIAKTVENVRKHSNICLIADKNRFVRVVAKATYKRAGTSQKHAGQNQDV